ncbi:hypothetical protein BRC94_07295 [Halobacteriales archaeon QS_5_70_17]|nr:MAG: hypothetical protein BRC94_07295 [Halobacteriales archaeon QS_5_70_17]
MSTTNRYVHDLDGAVVAPALEVLALLVGRVAGGNHQPLALGAPVVAPDALLAVGDLPDVPAAGQVERPDLRLRLVVPVRFLPSLVGLIVASVVRLTGSDLEFAVALAGREEGEFRSVGGPPRIARRRGPGQPVGVVAPVGEDDEQRLAPLVGVGIVLDGGEGDPFAVGRDDHLGDGSQFVEVLRGQFAGHGGGSVTRHKCLPTTGADPCH